MIELYSTDPRLMRLVSEAAAGHCEVSTYSPLYRDLPDYFDFAVTAGQLNAGVERFAASFGAMVVVLPEGGEYLAEKGSQGFASVIGTDYRRVKF